jgi:serine/threonine-protein kinase HipA
MILLHVWLKSSVEADVSNARLIGEVIFSTPDTSGGFESQFRYAPSWLSDNSSFPIDPVSLPLGPAEFNAKNLEPPLGVFDDSLPDSWGRKLLIKVKKLSRTEQTEPFLLREIASDPLGALAFSEGKKPLPERSSETMLELDELIESAARFEKGEVLADASLQRLFAAGGTPGGARPKALVVDDSGQHWIAKFPSSNLDGRFDVVGLEATAMKLAKSNWIQVPLTKLQRFESGYVQSGKQRKALLVKRFDVTLSGGRIHMISLKTLAKERTNQYVLSYREVAEIIRKESSSPQADVERFFAQMVFNAVIGNTDDHLKNFWMVRSEAGYRLSEAFDLVPNVSEQNEHTLVFHDERRCPDYKTFIDIASRWGVIDAPDIIQGVCAPLRQFNEVAKQMDVPEENVIEVGAGIRRRLDLICTIPAPQAK